MIEFFIIISGIIAFVSIFKEIKNKFFIFWMFTLFLIFFDGLRWEMGVDWKNYFKLFNNAHEYSFSGFEPGYRLYTKIFRNVTSSYPVYLFVTTAFIYITIFYTVFKITNLSFLSLFYLTAIIPWWSGSIRQMIAVSFFTLALKAIFERKKIKFIVFVLTAVMFHTSAIFFLPIYWLYGQSLITLSFIFFFLLFLSFFSQNLIKYLDFITKIYNYNRSYERYLGGNLPGSNPTLGFLRKILSLIGSFYFIYIVKISKNLKNVLWNKIKFTFFLSSLSIIFYYIGTYHIENTSSRLDLYTGTISFAIFIGLLEKFYYKKSNKILLYFFVLFLVVVYYLRLEHMSLFHPYSSIFYNYNYNRNLF
jgi:hypothetical protein